MNIKTITSTEGVNEVDFGSSASRFYWFQNIGTTAVHVSGKADITAGSDGVAELTAGDSVCIETLGGKVYVLGAGKVQIHNTGDKFRPFKNAPAAGGGITGCGNPVFMDGLQGIVPFSEITVSGDDIVGNEITLSVCGKNLIPYPFANSSKTVNGITFTDNDDGTVTANGTATADSVFYFANKTIPVDPKNKYYLSGCPTGGSGSTYDIVFASYDTDNAVVNAYNDTGNGKSVTVSGNAKNASLYIRIRSGQTVDNMIFRPQLEFGNTATAYEAYHGSTVKIAPDSNPYAVPNDIRQQDGLNVVSVSDGTLSVTGVRKNLALKRIWDKIDEITTAVIVANGE